MRPAHPLFRTSREGDRGARPITRLPPRASLDQRRCFLATTGEDAPNWAVDRTWVRRRVAGTRLERSPRAWRSAAMGMARIA